MTCYKCGGELVETEDGEHRFCKECGESADEKYICDFGHFHDYTKWMPPEEDECSETFDSFEDLLKSLDDEDDELSSNETQQARLELCAKLDEAEAEIAAGAKGEDFNVIAERTRNKLIERRTTIMNNAINTVMSIFGKYNPQHVKWLDKIICDIEDDFSVVELFHLYKKQELYKSFFMKLWATSDPDVKNRFFLCIEFDNQSFRIAYNYPLDENKDRNNYTVLPLGDPFEMPINDVKILRVEFFDRDKVDWDFIPSYKQYPKLDYIITNVDKSKRFYKCGIYSNDTMSNFDIIDAVNKQVIYTIEYDKNSDKFSLSTPDSMFCFECVFDLRWYYYYQDNRYNDIELLINAMGLA